MANKIKTTRIRLPPIDGNTHEFLSCSASGTRTVSRGKTDVKRNAPQQSIETESAMFPSLVQPICNYPHNASGYQERRKTQKSVKITHVEKIPTYFPGKAFAVLPPIGKTRPHSQAPSEYPSLQTVVNTRKASAQNDSQIQSMISSETKDSNASTFNKPRRIAIKKQASILMGVSNADRKQEYEVRNKSPTKASLEARAPTSSTKVSHHSDFKDDDDAMEDDDDDDLKMVNLSEVLQFLEWSSELREFLNGKNSLRRGATCSEIDTMLPHVVEVIRDMLLRQTMEELCMMW